MFSRKNIKELKTTVIGFLVMAASLGYPYLIENSSTWIFGIMFCVGLALVFMPNTLISSLRNFLKTNSNKEL